MTLTFLDIYNDVAGQAWSMYDGDAESVDEMESALKSSIPEKYENIFKNALITKSMLYAIASESDENYSGYKEQYERAYKILLDYTSGLKKERKVFW